MLTRSGRFLGTDRPRVWSPAGDEPRAGGGGAFLPRDAATPEAGKCRGHAPGRGPSRDREPKTQPRANFSNTILYNVKVAALAAQGNRAKEDCPSDQPLL